MTVFSSHFTSQGLVYVTLLQCFTAYFPPHLVCSVSYPESDDFLHSPAIQTKTCSNHFFFSNRNFIQVPETTLSKLLDSSGVRAGWLEMSCAPQPLEQSCHNWTSENTYWCDSL